MEQRKKRAIEIQNNIREVWIKKWDPIGVSDVPEAQDEYDGYIGAVYRLLVSRSNEKQVIDYLYEIETKNMGLGSSGKALKEVATALLKIDVNL